jgi:hypothetical protein
VIAETTTDRLGYFGLFTAAQTQPQEASMSRLANILYIASALRDRPRAIDRYIAYFGDPVRDQRRPRSAPSLLLNPALLARP